MKIFKRKQRKWSEEAISGFNLMCYNEMRKRIKKSDKEFYVGLNDNNKEYFNINDFIIEMELYTEHLWKFTGIRDNVYCFIIDTSEEYWN